MPGSVMLANIECVNLREHCCHRESNNRNSTSLRKANDMEAGMCQMKAYPDLRLLPELILCDCEELIQLRSGGSVLSFAKLVADQL